MYLLYEKYKVHELGSSTSITSRGTVISSALLMKVQRIQLPSSGQTTWILIGEDYVPIQPVNDYLRYLESLEKSPNTIQSYAYHLKLFWQYLQSSNFDWKEVGEVQLADFILWLRSPNPQVASMQSQQAKRTEKTINTILSGVFSFYEFHQRNETVKGVEPYRYIVQLNPRYKPLLYEMSKNKTVKTRLLKLKEPKRFPGTLTIEQVQQLIDSCNRIRDSFLIRLLYETGMRVGEGLGLRHEDLQLTAGKNEIHVVPRKDNYNKARSKSRQERIIQVSGGGLMQLYGRYVIDEYPEDVDSDYVFVNIWSGEPGTPMNYSTVTGLFKRLRKKTGIDVNPHLLRHTHATELIRAGMSMAQVQKRLGHNSIQTTINTYVHLTDDDMKEAYEKYLQKKTNGAD